MFSFEPLTLFIAVWFFWFVVETQTHNYFLILKSTKKKKKRHRPLFVTLICI